MKTAVALTALALASLTHAQPPSSLCCSGMGSTPKGCTRLPLVSKIALDVRQQCPAGTAVRTIAFTHKNDENLTFQESFQLVCCPSQRENRVTTDCQWGELTSNFALRTEARAPENWVVAGVRFTHKHGEDATHQQSFAIRSCRLERPAQTTWRGVGASGSTTKWHLQSHAGCGQTTASVPSMGLASSLGFSHEHGYNGTHQEFVRMGCVFN